tara:strand:- start:17232 stop:17549 length:318 start_codon:yes stop_codon:yes gene_type:complete
MHTKQLLAKKEILTALTQAVLAGVNVSCNNCASLTPTDICVMAESQDNTPVEDSLAFATDRENWEASFFIAKPHEFFCPQFRLKLGPDGVIPLGFPARLLPLAEG